MKRGGVALLALVTACGVDLPLRDDVTYTCNSSVDCPLELSCATAVHQCVRELDTTPPRLTSITASSRESVILVFDEPVSREQASSTSTFAIVRDDGQVLLIEGAASLEDGKSVVLRTGPQRGAAVYTMATAIGDIQGNAAVLEQSSFVGFGPAPDTAVPEATAPTRGSIIVVPPGERAAPHVTLAWTPRSGAIAYTLDLSSKADFSSIDATIEVGGSEASFALPVVEGRTYFWRVRSDATRGQERGDSSFTVLFDTIYVYCPASAACRSGDGIGSKNVPLAAVSRAVSLATDRGLSVIAIASRGNEPATGKLATYHEPVALTGGALTLRGGYEGTFVAAPSRAEHHTRIAYEGGVLVVLQNNGPIVIDKLEVEATLDITTPASTQNLGALTVDSPGADVTISDSFIGTTDIDPASSLDQFPNETNAIAVFSASAHPVHLDAASTVLAGAAQVGATAISALASHVDIVGTELVARPTAIVSAATVSNALEVLVGTVSMREARVRAGAATGGAVSLLASSGRLEHNTIVVDAAGACVGALLGSQSDEALVFARNTVVVTSRCTSGVGLQMFGEALTVANNVVVVNSTANATGLFVGQDSLALAASNTLVLGPALLGTGISLAGGFPDLANNLLVVGASSGSVCIQEINDSSDPKSLVNNFFLGCDIIYKNELSGGVLATIDATNGEAIGCAGCGTTRAVGNVVGAYADPFVALAGPDGDADTPDGDFRLASAAPGLADAGVDTTTASCGSHESPRDCGAVIADLAGLPRTVPVSVGAHERD